MSTAKKSAAKRERADRDDDIELPAEEAIEAAELKSEIEQTREQMGQTLEAIKERLSPENVKETVKDKLEEQLDNAKEKVKETIAEQYQGAKDTVREATIGRVEHMMHRASDTVDDAKDTIVDTVKRNPIPVALVGIGLTWLLLSARDSRKRRGWRAPELRDDRYDDDRSLYGYPRGIAQRDREHENGIIETVKDKASGMVHRAEDAAGRVAHGAEDMAHRAQHRVQEVGQRARHQAARIEHRIEDTFYENPLALGALALAAGAAAGLALPQTRRENEWVGEARDQLVDKARDVAHTALGKVQQAANEALPPGENNLAREEQSPT